MKWYSLILPLLLCTAVLIAADPVDESEKKITRDYSSIKKEQVKDYRAGAHEAEKDRVKEWFTEDIDYYERLIKLKSDYRDWAMDKIDKDQGVIFSEYVDGKNFTGKEQEILYDYHLRLFSRGNAEKVVKRPGKRPSPAVAAMVKEKGRDMPVDPAEPGHENVENDETFHGLILPAVLGGAMAFILGIVAIVMKKRKSGKK